MTAPLQAKEDITFLRTRSVGKASLPGSAVSGGVRTATMLDLDPTLVARARELAALAAQPVIDLAHRHTTVSVERAVLRLRRATGRTR